MEHINAMVNKAQKCIDTHSKQAIAVSFIPLVSLPIVFGVCAKMIVKLDKIFGIPTAKGWDSEILHDVLAGVIAAPVLAIPVLGAGMASVYIKSIGEERRLRMNHDNVPTIPAKSIVYKNSSPSSWFGLDYNMNIYRGCSHGCIYCDSRSACFQNSEFNTVKVKENALQIVRDDLRRKVKTGVIVKLSITTADDGLSKQLEPTASVTSERFNALRVLADNGIFCGVFIIPMLPFITDSTENLTKLLRMIKEAGAKFVYTYMGMTLRPGSREYF